MIIRTTTRASALALIMLSFASNLPSCTFAIGYFYQVTALRGRVIGADRSSLGPFRWLKGSPAIPHAHLTLFEYRWPIHSPTDAPLVKESETDADGRFDFGPLKVGHYTLVVRGAPAKDGGWSPYDRFDVEVKDLPRSTESVIVDVSTILPDCTGGHLILVKSK